MQPARIKPHAKEHTNNPVQKPNFRGHAAGDVEVTRACGKAPRPSKDDSRESLDDACHPPQARRATSAPCTLLPRCQFLYRHEHACSTNTSRHDTSRHTASCWSRCKSLHR